MAALLAGQATDAVAKEYNLPAATVRSWKSRQQNGESVATVATQKKERIGELLIDHLAMSLETMQKQVRFAGRESWLEKQSAENLAVLYGVTADKTIRLLEALGANTDADNP